LSLTYLDTYPLTALGPTRGSVKAMTERVSDITVFVLKRDVKLQPSKHWRNTKHQSKPVVCQPFLHLTHDRLGTASFIPAFQHQ